MLLTHKIVQPFIRTLEEALPYRVTITDVNGYIIGSSDTSRLNQFHPSAYEIIQGRQPVETLSGGEQAKVKLCRLLLRPCNFLILDEPTHHLDRETKEVLGQALREFQGSVILVTHEEAFYRTWADRVMEIGK